MNHFLKIENLFMKINFFFVNDIIDNFERIWNLPMEKETHSMKNVEHNHLIWNNW